ncbi:hypothetical protein [Sphingomonas alba]|uniref:Uncharacterized protein n=1 Tax=Sphingomonas alba TaxID=2908208 RepID=A0ABT0RLU4_9SPHN|nr:hypothetical protein [Sphingomonas alba]MCL6683533.1 hypothetical protein [Sphingomonas alba]
MSAIEWLLNLFTLLLGFILVEVLSGLMRTLRARLPSGPGVKADIHIGWLTPMLGAYIMLNVLLMWGTLWVYSPMIPVGYDTMTLGLILCSFYYFAASMIFPDKPRDWPDVDAWFWLHRRQVLGCILAANIPVMLPDYLVWKATASEMAVNSVVVVLQLGSLLLAIFARKHAVVLAALGLLIAIHLSFIPLEYLHRQGIW